MKSIILISLSIFLITIEAKAQQFKYVDAELILDSVGNTNNSKKEIFSNAIGFVSSYFKKSKAVIDVRDLELGELVFSGSLLGEYIDSNDEDRPMKIDFTCHIYIKDKKYKVVMKQLKRVNSILYKYGPSDSFPFHEGALTSKDKDDIYSLSLIKNFVTELSKRLNKTPDNDF